MSPLVLFGISIVRGVTGSSFPPRFFPTVKFGFSLWMNILFPVQQHKKRNIRCESVLLTIFIYPKVWYNADQPQRYQANVSWQSLMLVRIKHQVMYSVWNHFQVWLNIHSNIHLHYIHTFFNFFFVFKWKLQHSRG